MIYLPVKVGTISTMTATEEDKYLLIKILLSGELTTPSSGLHSNSSIKY